MFNLRRSVGAHTYSCLPIVNIKACTTEFVINVNQSKSRSTRVTQSKQEPISQSESRVVEGGRSNRN